MPRQPILATAVAVAGLVLGVAQASSAQVAQRTHGPDPAPLTHTAPTARAASAPGSWCPNANASENQVDNGAYRYHAIYAHPADRPSRLPQLGATLQTHAFAASGLIERQYGRAIRFDIGTPCGPGQLDISSVQLPLTETQMTALAAAGGTATFEALAQALRLAGFGVAADDESPEELAARRLNFLVWLDGPAPGRSCGQGTALLDSTRSETNLNNTGGKLAVVFRNGSGFCGPDVVRHEIGHNLGALQPDAPNTEDGVHCNDAFEDTMCTSGSPKLGGGPFNGVYFDYGNDDYWDPPEGEPLGWWTLNLSRFLCERSDCNRPAVPDPPAPPPAPRSAAPAEPTAAGSPAEPSAPASPAEPTAAATPAARPESGRRARALRSPRLARRVRRGSVYTRIRLRATGVGSARLVVRCPRERRLVARRRVRLPHVFRIRTTCRAPQARLTRWQRPRAAIFDARR